MLPTAGSALLVLTLVLILVPERFTGTLYGRWAPPVLVVLLLVSPVSLALLEFIRGVTGDLSIVSLGVMVGICSGRLTGRKLIDAPSRRWLVAVSLLAGLVLYPSALGLTALESYRWGYSRFGMIVACVAVGLMSWYVGANWFAGCLAAALGCHAAEVLESPNLWDYVLDPVLAVSSFGILVTDQWKKISAWRTMIQKPRRAHEFH